MGDFYFGDGTIEEVGIDERLIAIGIGNCMFVHAHSLKLKKKYSENIENMGM